MKYESPNNLLELLDGVVKAAAQTRFYRSRLNNKNQVRSIEEFRNLPLVSITDLRNQNFTDTIVDQESLQWIVGSNRPRDRYSLPIAENSTVTATRYDLFCDALKDHWDLTRVDFAVIVTSKKRLYYAAEISTILGYIGIPAHVFTETEESKVYKQLRLLETSLLIVLTNDFDEKHAEAIGIPTVTFRLSHRLKKSSQIDLYTVDELGFLGHSRDLNYWTIYNDQYLYEQSGSGSLVVTALYNKIQPLLRIDTVDVVKELGQYGMKLDRLK